MSDERAWVTTARDRNVLRGLAARVAAIATESVMAERRRLWIAHAGLRGERPMILAETQGVTDEILRREELTCGEAWARDIEFALRMRIYQHEVVDDDMVCEPWLGIPWQVEVGDYGVSVDLQRGDNAGRLGSYVWDPPIKDIGRDMAKLHPRALLVDREHTVAWKDHLDRLVGDILPVRIRGNYYWTMGLTWRCIDLVGLQGLMLAMVDDPDGLHALMAFLRDDHLHLIDWLEEEGLYTLNNESDYVGSGTVGYTDELPRPEWSPGDAVTSRDLWVLSESQETVGVSPGMFEEFVFRYQLPIIERFGLCYYGCCEPVHARWYILQTIPNLRRVSISPWCDQEYMAAALGDRFIFCRKPSPALISGAVWDVEAIRADLRHTLEVTGGKHLELVMKDVHTLADQPERLGRWVKLAREESARYA